MKLLIDMNLSPAWVQFLADSGFDSVHWSSIGRPSAPDTQIMDYASANGLVVFTHDLDFGALLAKRKTRQPSVLQVRAQDVLPRTWKPAPWSQSTRIGAGFGCCQSSSATQTNSRGLARRTRIANASRALWTGI
jgi:predicted nuclease of predicted toxin-antitoxin system